MKKFPHYFQLDKMDCGPSCLRMIAKYYKRNYSLQEIRERCFITREGVSMLGISDAAESIGFRTNGVRLSFESFVNKVHLPCILHWNQNHFVVCYEIIKKKTFIGIDYKLKISDPASGQYILNKDEFLKYWISTRDKEDDTGTLLILEPTPALHDQEIEKHNFKRGLSYFIKYIVPYKKQLVQLIIGMLIGSILQLIFPFLTQAMIDNGINNSNLSFITLILIAQLVLFTTQLVIEFIRNWIVLHMNTRINISLISDFLIKLMKLPLHFFDTKYIGDIMQRIGDHGRIKALLTGTSLYTIFSFLNFIIFACILAYYNLRILLVFLIGNILYVMWIIIFLKYRRELDYKRFAQLSKQQSSLIQIITGMQEIKMNNCEKQQRWVWEGIQVNLFKINIRGLVLGQYQQMGTVFLNQLTNLFISYISAKLVVEGSITLGMMMSISYIVGQLSGPIAQLIELIQSMQDAKISLERLNEIHNQEDEEQFLDCQLNDLPENKTILIEHVSFSYDGADRNYALRDINLTIPHHKVTAIVGASGSGKTTLIKLLMGFYQPNKGDIKIDNTSLKQINPYVWRQKIGCVMQDGFIFSDTIANNITVGEESINKKKLLEAVETANIKEFIDSLPLGYNTKIGMEGNGISQGQKQRVLIARSVYKTPDYLFFDEATNALDAANEQEIMNKLNNFYKERTVVIAAHRLSTVQHADKIIVLDKGVIIEEGTHCELINLKKAYYTLVKKQLELGS